MMYCAALRECESALRNETQRSFDSDWRQGPNTNQSQFFITLDRADELDRKNTIFGKVVGDTLYNVLKVNDLEIGPNERPVRPSSLFTWDRGGGGRDLNTDKVM
jgi:cyclophilin family peptidyl-prolyl cis-trans isomerase